MQEADSVIRHTPTEEEGIGLRRIRRRRWWALVLPICLPIAMLLSLITAAMLHEWFGQVSDAAALPALLTFGVWAYVGIRASYSRCPRCGGFFFVRHLWMNPGPLRRACVHCGLRLQDAGSSTSPQAKAERRTFRRRILW